MDAVGTQRLEHRTIVEPGVPRADDLGNPRGDHLATKDARQIDEPLDARAQCFRPPITVENLVTTALCGQNARP